MRGTVGFPVGALVGVTVDGNRITESGAWEGVVKEKEAIASTGEDKEEEEEEEEEEEGEEEEIDVEHQVDVRVETGEDESGDVDG